MGQSQNEWEIRYSLPGILPHRLVYHKNCKGKHGLEKRWLECGITQCQACGIKIPEHLTKLVSLANRISFGTEMERSPRV